MPSIFDSMLHADQSLFRDEDSLDPSYIPKLIPYREQEQKAIACCMKPLFSQKNGRNVMIHGPPGIGKTVACRHIFQEVEETTDDIIPLYINCWKKKTSFRVIAGLCEQLGYHIISNKSTDELFKEVKDLLRNRAAAFTFDEIDKVEDFDFLYALVEAVLPKSIILISNYKEWFTSLDERITSRLGAELLAFNTYTEKETAGILAERRKYAFVSGVWDAAAFDAITKESYRARDIRCGLHLMRQAGIIAESRSSKKIIVEHAKEAIEKQGPRAEHIELDSDEQLILGLVSEAQGQKMGDIYNSYKVKAGAKAYKTFQRKVQRLSEAGMLKASRANLGKDGNTTILSLK
ncbi:TPA: AAA family ATPase [Candidatus Woesearchaeota archaeon]|nr:AAA family ATPase [Candidatus Woesearchaeota archaeon]HII68324.1 AAA family ATPase [Candidatus Woesearchaeota archaeon]